MAFTRPILGNGLEYDMTAYPASNLKTTTSQYKCVIMDPTAASDLQVALISNSATSDNYKYAIGIVQSYQTANSDTVLLRTHGISKAYADGTFAPGDALMIANATAGANTAGFVTKYVIGDASAGAALVPRFIVGRAMQAATVTGQAVTIEINPSWVML